MTDRDNGGAPASDDLDRMFDEGVADEAAAGIPSMTTEGGEPDDDQPEPKPEAPEEPQDDDWRHDPSLVAPAAPKPTPEPAQPELKAPPNPTGLLRELLDERDKRQKAEAEAERYRAEQRKREEEAQLGPEPDRWADPEGHDRWMAEVRKRERQADVSPVDARVRQVTEYYSRREAVREHGEETVNEAWQALLAAAQRGEINGPAAQAELEKSVDPYGDIVRWYDNTPSRKETRLREQIRKEFEAEYAGTAPARSAPAPQPAAAAPPPRQSLPSLNRAVGNAGQLQGGDISEEDIFNAAPAFGKRRA